MQYSNSFAVGVDIACRMCMSVFDIEASFLEQKGNMLKNYLLEILCLAWIPIQIILCQMMYSTCRNGKPPM
jgi:hypothetical protein